MKRVLLGRIVTEKSSIASSMGKLCFYVDFRASKVDVKKSVELFFSVKVDSVSTINVSGLKRKKKGFRGSSGVSSRFKKAIVKLTKDSSIDEVFGGEL
jgi:large subunit ribosomal protein L23